MPSRAPACPTSGHAWAECVVHGRTFGRSLTATLLVRSNIFHAFRFRTWLNGSIDGPCCCSVSEGTSQRLRDRRRRTVPAHKSRNWWRCRSPLPVCPRHALNARRTSRNPDAAHVRGAHASHAAEGVAKPAFAQLRQHGTGRDTGTRVSRCSPHGRLGLFNYQLFDAMPGATGIRRTLRAAASWPLRTQRPQPGQGIGSN